MKDVTLRICCAETDTGTDTTTEGFVCVAAAKLSVWVVGADFDDVAVCALTGNTPIIKSTTRREKRESNERMSKEGYELGKTTGKVFEPIEGARGKRAQMLWQQGLALQSQYRGLLRLEVRLVRMMLSSIAEPSGTAHLASSFSAAEINPQPKRARNRFLLRAPLARLQAGSRGSRRPSRFRRSPR